MSLKNPFLTTCYGTKKSLKASVTLTHFYKQSQHSRLPLVVNLQDNKSCKKERRDGSHNSKTAQTTENITGN